MEDRRRKFQIGAVCVIGNLNGHVSPIQSPGIWCPDQKSVTWKFVVVDYKDSPMPLCSGRERLSKCIEATLWSKLLTIRQTLVIHSNLTFIVYVLRYKLWGNNKNKMKYHLYVCFAILSSLRSVPYNLTCLPTIWLVYLQRSGRLFDSTGFTRINQKFPDRNINMFFKRLNKTWKEMKYLANRRPRTSVEQWRELHVSKIP